MRPTNGFATRACIAFMVLVLVFGAAFPTFPVLDELADSARATTPHLTEKDADAALVGVRVSLQIHLSFLVGSLPLLGVMPLVRTRSADFPTHLFHAAISKKMKRLLLMPIKFMAIFVVSPRFV